jgi:hypothetical protein
MKASQRISTIERQYPDQWVLVEVTRVSRGHQVIAGRLLAHSPDEDEITRQTIGARKECPEAHLWAFYTGDRIPKGMILMLTLACF